jgi:hypothetical protein
MSHHQKNTNHVQTINKVLTHPNYVHSLAQQKINTQNNRGTTQWFLQWQKEGWQVRRSGRSLPSRHRGKGNVMLTVDTEPSNGYHGQQIKDPIPRLPHFQGFVEQEGKERGRHTYSLPKKDTTNTWTSGGDIGSIPVDTYSERAQKRRKKLSQSSSKPRGTHTRRQSEKGEIMRVLSQP